MVWQDSWHAPLHLTRDPCRGVQTIADLQGTRTLGEY